MLKQSRRHSRNPRRGRVALFAPVLIPFFWGMGIYLPLTAEAEPLSEENRIVRNVLASQFEIPETNVLDENFWMETQLVENENFNIYLTHDIDSVSEFITERLQDAHGSATDDESAKNEVREFFSGPATDEFDLTQTSLYKEFRARFSKETEAADAWAGLLLQWHNEVVKHHSNRYYQALGEFVNDVMPALTTAIKNTHDIAREGRRPSGVAGTGGYGAEAPSYVSPMILRYMRHKAWRDARNEHRRQAYMRLSQ